MKLPRFIGLKSSLRARLIFWFLHISLFPLALFTYLSYESSKKMLIDQAIQSLNALNVRQSKNIEIYFRDKEKITISFAKDASVSNAIKEMSTALSKYGKDSKAYQALEEEYRYMLAFRSELLGYSNLFLITNDGTIVFSVFPSTLVGTNLLSDSSQINPLVEIFENAKDLISTQMSNFIYHDPKEPPASFIAAPILESEQVGGVLMTQIDNSSIYELVTDYTGLGETGETILVSEVDDNLITQSPLRKSSDQAFIHVIPDATPFGAFIQQVINGKRIVDRVLDYNNRKTLMVGRSLLHSMNWGIITKIDLDELLAPTKKLQYLYTIMAFATAIAVILTAIHVANTITNPILAMIKRTRLIAAGDFSQRVEIEGDDEISHLAESFNDMAAQLDNMIQHLDIIVAKRTEEVEQQNNKLENTIDELQMTQNRLITQEKLASLGSLTAGIAHEIKNPLNFINNFAELSLQVDTDMEERLDKIKNKIPVEDAEILHEYLETLKLNISKIYEHGKRADSIVKNMLHHSRGTPGDMALTDVNALLSEYIALSFHGMRAQDSSFNVKIEKFLDPALPKTYLVPQEISRVFLNLLNNAYYSVHLKKQELKDAYQPIVRATTQYNHKLIVISIWDNGGGISESIFPKLFTPFFTTKPVGEGTGLGLSLSYNIIVQGHQGTLTADSKYKEFAEFVITLPTISKI